MKIKYAFAHAPVIVPGKIMTEKTLSEDKIKGIKMEYDEKVNPHVLKIKIGDAKAIVPITNLQVMVVDE